MSDCEEERRWEFASGMDSVLSYRGYLRRYPKGPHSQKARRRIARKWSRIAMCVAVFIAVLALAFLLFHSVCESFAKLIANR